MKKQIVYLLAAAIVLVIGCAKELSFETGGSPSSGSLQDDATGDCLPKTVNGTYEAAKALVASNNTITVSVNVVTTGSYTIYTDTVNGYYFRAIGTFTTLGTNTVTLRGVGTPFISHIDNFVVTYGTSTCDIQVTVLPAGAGGPAAFTLNSTAGTCSITPPAGAYVQGVPLNGTNTVVLDVTVTTIGTYNIVTTATNGITFSGSGAFLTPGAGTITLTGSGTPTTAGNNTIPVSFNTSACSFTVNVVGPAVMTIDCGSATVNGTYQAGTTLVSSSNTVDIPVNVTTAGAYSITTASVNGMVFTGSGSLSAGANTITLAGSGTPTAAGNFSIVVSFGAASCSFPVTVTGAAIVNWKFTEGTTTYQGTTDVDGAHLTVPLSPFTLFDYSGSNATDDILFALSDLSGGIQNNETYSTSTTTSNGATFAFVVNGGADTYNADPSTTGASLTFKVTSHNTATKTITGIFSGTVKNSANVTKTISGGTFTAVYP